VKNILIVDDDPEILSLLPEFLVDLPVQCHTVTSGQGALNMMKERRFDIVISDIKMPEMDGLALLQKLQGQGFTGPVVLMTGIVDINMMYLAWKLGAFDFLDKPIDIEKLLTIVSRALKIDPSVTNLKTSQAAGARKVTLHCDVDESTYMRLQAYCRYHHLEVGPALESMIKDFVNSRLTA
jgi:DNA-binding NtrC family response regulator